MAHTLDKSRVPEMLQQLLNDDRLTKWERGFCESISAQLDDGKELTEQDGGQLDILERIWLRY